MIIKNGLVFNEKGFFENKDIFINNNIIVESIDKVEDKTIIDATDKYVIPGLIDTHIHGSVGYDFCKKDKNNLVEIAKFLKSKGITSFCPTSMTLDENFLVEIFETVKNNLPKECADIVGIHMEGPFISEDKKGAQDKKYIINPSVDFFKKLNQSCGNMIKIITMAPEVEGGLDFIKEMSSVVNISLGHTTASYEISKKAYELGANRATHLFNAMPPLNHREPSVVGASLDNENVFVEVICDGIHIHESVIRAIFKMYGDDRVVLISDSIMASGMNDGKYELGGQDVTVYGNKAMLSDGTIAGSNTNLFDCMKKAVSFGVKLESAIKATTQNPAKSIDIYDKYGSIDAGKFANLVIMDKDLNICNIIK